MSDYKSLYSVKFRIANPEQQWLNSIIFMVIYFASLLFMTECCTQEKKVEMKDHIETSIKFTFLDQVKVRNEFVRLCRAVDQNNKQYIFSVTEKMKDDLIKSRESDPEFITYYYLLERYIPLNIMIKEDKKMYCNF